MQQGYSAKVFSGRRTSEILSYYGGIMEDFAQVFGHFPDDKYEQRSYANIAKVLWAQTERVSSTCR